jgi:saccharopine dehydrogenase (NAD+, L-lysine-forming)
MTHLWVRAEERPHEARVGLTPEGAAALIKAGINVTVEDSPHRAIPIDGYRAAGAAIAAPGSWRQAPATPSSSA